MVVEALSTSKRNVHDFSRTINFGNTVRKFDGAKKLDFQSNVARKSDSYEHSVRSQFGGEQSSVKKFEVENKRTKKFDLDQTASNFDSIVRKFDVEPGLVGKFDRDEESAKKFDFDHSSTSKFDISIYGNAKKFDNAKTLKKEQVSAEKLDCSNTGFRKPDQERNNAVKFNSYEETTKEQISARRRFDSEHNNDRKFDSDQNSAKYFDYEQYDYVNQIHPKCKINLNAKLDAKSDFVEPLSSRSSLYSIPSIEWDGRCRSEYLYRTQSLPRQPKTSINKLYRTQSHSGFVNFTKEPEPTHYHLPRCKSCGATNSSYVWELTKEEKSKKMPGSLYMSVDNLPQRCLDERPINIKVTEKHLPVFKIAKLDTDFIESQEFSEDNYLGDIGNSFSSDNQTVIEKVTPDPDEVTVAEEAVTNDAKIEKNDDGNVAVKDLYRAHCATVVENVHDEICVKSSNAEINDNTLSSTEGEYHSFTDELDFIQTVYESPVKDLVEKDIRDYSVPIDCYCDDYKKGSPVNSPVKTPQKGLEGKTVLEPILEESKSSYDDSGNASCEKLDVKSDKDIATKEKDIEAQVSKESVVHEEDNESEINNNKEIELKQQVDTETSMNKSINNSNPETVVINVLNDLFTRTETVVELKQELTKSKSTKVTTELLEAEYVFGRESYLAEEESDVTTNEIESVCNVVQTAMDVYSTSDDEQDFDHAIVESVYENVFEILSTEAVSSTKRGSSVEYSVSSTVELRSFDSTAEFEKYEIVVDVLSRLINKVDFDQKNKEVYVNLPKEKVGSHFDVELQCEEMEIEVLFARKSSSEDAQTETTAKDKVVENITDSTIETTKKCEPFSNQADDDADLKREGPLSNDQLHGLDMNKQSQRTEMDKAEGTAINCIPDNSINDNDTAKEYSEDKNETSLVEIDRIINVEAEKTKMVLKRDEYIADVQNNDSTDCTIANEEFSITKMIQEIESNNNFNETNLTESSDAEFVQTQRIIESILYYVFNKVFFYLKEKEKGRKEKGSKKVVTVVDCEDVLFTTVPNWLGLETADSLKENSKTELSFKESCDLEVAILVKDSPLSQDNCFEAEISNDGLAKNSDNVILPGLQTDFDTNQSCYDTNTQAGETEPLKKLNATPEISPEMHTKIEEVENDSQSNKNVTDVETCLLKETELNVPNDSSPHMNQSDSISHGNPELEKADINFESHESKFDTNTDVNVNNSDYDPGTEMCLEDIKIDIPHDSVKEYDKENFPVNYEQNDSKMVEVNTESYKNLVDASQSPNMSDNYVGCTCDDSQVATAHETGIEFKRHTTTEDKNEDRCFHEEYSNENNTEYTNFTDDMTQSFIGDLTKDNEEEETLPNECYTSADYEYRDINYTFDSEREEPTNTRNATYFDSSTFIYEQIREDFDTTQDMLNDLTIADFQNPESSTQDYENYSNIGMASEIVNDVLDRSFVNESTDLDETYVLERGDMNTAFVDNDFYSRSSSPNRETSVFEVCNESPIKNTQESFAGEDLRVLYEKDDTILGSPFVKQAPVISMKQTVNSGGIKYWVSFDDSLTAVEERPLFAAVRRTKSNDFPSFLTVNFNDKEKFERKTEDFNMNENNDILNLNQSAHVDLNKEFKRKSILVDNIDQSQSPNLKIEESFASCTSTDYNTCESEQNSKLEALTTAEPKKMLLYDSRVDLHTKSAGRQYASWPPFEDTLFYRIISKFRMSESFDPNDFESLKINDSI